MGHVAMYCTTVFFRLEIYVSISSIPAALIAPPKEGYYSVPNVCCRGILPKIHRDTMWWTTPEIRLMQGINTHVSKSNIRMAWKTAM